MKATIECEKCGKSWVMDVKNGTTLTKVTHLCELTYGPLTEKMVQSALATAAGFAHDETIGEWRNSKACNGQARFVLRLLDSDLFRPPYKHYEGFTYAEMHELYKGWLLNLARKP